MGQTIGQLPKPHLQEMLCAQGTSRYTCYNVPDNQVKTHAVNSKIQSAMHVLGTTGEAAKLQSTLLDT
jgi:hypothetical protein